MNSKNNVALIGMAGSGKSVLGKKLAYALRYIFFDLDDRIEVNFGKQLAEVIQKIGENKFLQLEEQELLSFLKVNPYHAVIAPGGSIVYSERAMKELAERSFIIFINTPFEIIRVRTENAATRGGVVGINRLGSLEAVYEERLPLYKRWADVTIDIGRSGEDTATKKIIKLLPEELKKQMSAEKGVDVV